MTYEEAKRRLKDHFTIHSGGVVVSKIEIDRPHPKLDEAEKMMYEALEKQIPKKPNDIGHLGNKDIYTYGKCPICGDGVNYEFAYCPECGQKLDWTEGGNGQNNA